MVAVAVAVTGLAPEPQAWAADDVEQPHLSGPTVAAAPAPEVKQVTSEPVSASPIESWTPTSHSTTVDGTTTLQVFAQPKFKRTTTGWVEVDDTITAGTGQYPFEALGLVNPVHFGATAASLMTIDTIDGAVTFGLDGAANSAPVLQDATLTYPAVFPGVDLVMTTTGGRVAKQLVLHDENAQQTFHFTMTAGDHTLGTPVRGEAESWSFPTATAFGTGIELPAPAAWSQDSDGATGLPGSAHQSVRTTAAGYAVDLSLDPLWAAEADFPVVLDPAVEWTSSTWYNDNGLSVAFGPQGATTCDGGPCQLADPLGDGVVAVGDMYRDEPNLGTYVTYAGADMSGLADRQVTRSILHGYDYTTVQVRDLCDRIDESSTGKDVDDARCGPEKKQATSNYDVWAPGIWNADVTDSVRKAVRGTGATGHTAGFALGHRNYQFQDVDGHWYDGGPDGRYINAPYLQIVYTGYPVPHPLTAGQTYGCACWAGKSSANQAHAADPVNTATGALLESFSDLSLASVGESINLTRTYNSLDTTGGAFGPGWSFAYGASLREDETGVITFRDGSGTQTRFGAVLDGGYAPLDPAVSAQLTDGPDGQRIMRNLTGSTMTFDSAGNLVAAADVRGQGITLSYTAGRLTKVTDALGQFVTFAWDTAKGANGRIISATASDGRTVTYTHEAFAGARRLMSSTAVDGATTTYAYDKATGGISRITDALGHVRARNTYDPDTKRIVSQLDQTGAKTTFAWDAATQTATITDPTGRTRQDVYNGGNLVKQIDGKGNTTETYYDGDNNAAASAGASDLLFQTEYDDRDRLIRRTAPAPLYSTERWTYDDADRVTSHTDAAGTLTSYEYDGDGQLIKQTTLTYPYPTTSTYTYTTGLEGVPAHLLATSTDPLGRTTTNTYNAAGDLVAITTPAGRTTTYTYDDQHRPLTMTSPGGHVTSTTYDAAGRVLTVTDPTGATTTNTYDAAGRLATTTDAAGNSITYTYDNADRVIRTKHSSGRVTRTSYDDAGRVATTTDPLGAVTSFDYDDAGRVVATTDPLGHTTRQKYDVDGNLVEQTDATGASTTFGYDALGRQITVIDADGVTQTTEYDALGQVIRTLDGLGGWQTFTYDQLGRQTSSVDSDSVQSGTDYDLAGQVIVSWKPRANDSGPYYWRDETTYTYDPDGNLLATVEPRGNVPAANPEDFTTHYEYDADGRQVSTTDALGRTTTTTYDAAGRPTVATNAAGGTTTTNYNALGWIASVTNAAGATTSYNYDAYGNVTRRVDPLNHITKYTYDKAGHRLTTTDPLGRVTQASYDAAGNTVAVVTPAGTSTAEPDDGTISYSYDAANRATATTYSDATPALGLTYTSAGRLAEATRTQGGETVASTSYQYDAAGRTAAIATTGPGGGISTYSYTSAGRRKGVGWPTGLSASYSYNSVGELTRAESTGQDSTPAITYDYTPSGQISTTTRRGTNPVTTTATYDNVGQLSGLNHTSSAGSLAGYEITRDSLGNPTSVASWTPNDAWTALYGFDAISRLTSVCKAPMGGECQADSAKTTYTYDKVGNRRKTAVTSMGRIGPRTVTTVSTFDAADQLTSQSVGGAVVASFGYDSNGHQVTSEKSGSTRTNVFNLAGELSEVTLPNGDVVAYAHDASGNQASRTVNGALSAAWDWDVSSGLHVRVGERDAAGARVVAWQPDPMSPIGAPISSASAEQRNWLLTDPFGSVQTASSVDDGSVTGTRSTDPFGVEIANATGVLDGELFGFHAQYRDPETGSYDMRARTYDPETGRLDGIDPVDVSTGAPAANAYWYAAGNPLVLTDPTGNTPYCVTSGMRPCSEIQSRFEDRVAAAFGSALYDSDGGYVPAKAGESYSVGVGNYFISAGNGFQAARGSYQIPELHGPNECNDIYAASNAIGEWAGPQIALGPGGGGALAARGSLFAAKGSAELVPALASAGSRRLLPSAAATAAKATAGRGGAGLVAQGAAGVDRTVADLEAAGGRVLGREITLETGGLRTRQDLFAELPCGQQCFIEVKTGPSAGLTPNQTVGFPVIRGGGAVPRGANAAAAGLKPGVPLGPTPVWIVHQPWPLAPPLVP